MSAIKGFEQIDHRIIYLSLLVIMTLAMVSNLSTEGLLSSASGFVIMLIALSNLGYLMEKRRRKLLNAASVLNSN